MLLTYLVGLLHGLASRTSNVSQHEKKKLSLPPEVARSLPLAVFFYVYAGWYRHTGFGDASGILHVVRQADERFVARDTTVDETTGLIGEEPDRQRSL